MNEEALQYSFDLFVNDGYNGDFDQYKKLIEEDEEALKYSFELFSKDGYEGNQEKFTELVGVGKPLDVVAEDATVTSKTKASESMASPSVDIFSEQYKAMKPQQRQSLHEQAIKDKVKSSGASIEKNQFFDVDKEKALVSGKGINIEGAKSIANEIIDLGREIFSWKTAGVEQAEAVPIALDLLSEAGSDKEIDPEVVYKWMENINKKSKAPEAQAAMESFEKDSEKAGGGISGFLTSFVKNPKAGVSVLVQSAISQIYSLYTSEDVRRNAALAGAAGGVVAGEIGAAATAGSSGLLAPFAAVGVGFTAARSAMAGGMYSIELASTFSELLMKEAGGDMSYDNIKSILEDEEKITDIKNKAHRRGLAVAGIEFITAGLAKGVGAKMAKSGFKPISTAGAVAATEMAGGGLGEASGMYVAGQDFDINEIGMEAFAGSLGTGLSLGKIQIDQAQYNVNKLEINKIVEDTESKDVNNITDLFTNDKTIEKAAIDITKINNSSKILDDEVKTKVEKGDITEEEGKQIRENFRDTQGNINRINASKIDEKYTPEIVDLLNKKQKLQNEIEAGVPELTQNQQEEVKEINKKLQDIAATARRSKLDKGAIAVAEAIGIKIDRVNSEQLQSELENINNSRKRRLVTKQDWDSASEEQKEEFLLQAFKDPDEIDGLQFEKFEDLPDVATSNMSIEPEQIDIKEAKKQLGFILQSADGTQRVLLNEDQAKKQNSVSTAVHEVLHGVLFNTLKDKGVGTSLGSSLIDRLKSIDLEKVENSNFKERLQLYIDDAKISDDVTYEEALTLFSEALITGDLKYNESVFTKIGDVIRRTLAPVVNVKFDTGKDIFNFIKDYNRTIETGKGLKTIKKAAKGIKGKLTESQELNNFKGVVLKNSKSTKGVESSNKVQEIYDTKGTSEEAIFEIIEEFKPITAKIVATKRDAESFETFKDELQGAIEFDLVNQKTGKDRSLRGLILDYDPSKGVPLAAYINRFLPDRAIEAVRQILPEYYSDDIETARGVVSTEDNVSIEEAVDKSIKPTKEQKSKLRRQIRLPDEQVEKVREAVRKTFGTRLPPLQSPEFKKALRKAFDTELFKELKTNVFKARKDYEFFMSQNWKALYDAIPQETLNQSFAPFREPVLDETGKQKREKTPEGERIFKKKNITKEEFLDYFFNPNVGVSTRGTRKDAIVRMLAQELGFDATMETIQEPKVAEKLQFLDKEKTVPKVAEKIDKDPTIKFSKAREIQNTQVRLKNNPSKNITLIDVFAEDLKSFDKNLEKQESFDSFYKKSIAGFKNKYFEEKSKNGFDAKPWKPIIYEYWVAKNMLLKYPNLEVPSKEGLARGFDSTGEADLVFVDKNNRKNKFNVEVKSTQDAMVSSAKVKLKDGKFVAAVPEKQNDVIFSIVNELTKDKISNIKKALGTNDDEIINRAFTNPTASQLQKIQKQLLDKKGKPSKQFLPRTEADFKNIAKSITSKGTNVFVLQNKKGDTIMYALDEKTQKQILESLGIEIPTLDGKIKFKVRLKGNTGARKTYTPTLEPEFDRNVFDKGKVILGPEVKFAKSAKTTDAKLNKEFNEIIANKTSIAASTTISDAKARLAGEKRKRFRFFIPPSADDLVGLLYYTLGKGKVGEAQLKWYNKNIISPFAQAMEAVSRDRNETARRFNKIVKDLGIIPKKLRKEIPGDVFTQEQAVRVYIWNKQGMKIPGLSNTDKTKLLKYIDDNPNLKQFGDRVITVNRGYEYAKPGEGWLAGTITSDLKETLNTTKRAAYLQQWQRNVDTIFSKENLNKLEAAYGREYRKAVENILQRMKTGRNRDFTGDKLTSRFVDWINGSVGAIMFFNTRSAILQTLSAANFINFTDNNVFAAAKAFANQKQYWSDFKMLFNSDFLIDRRQGLRMDINEADLATAAKQGGTKGVVSRLLKIGFTPTQIADSFAIAAGGSTFYRNRLNSLMKDGMDQKAAEKIAFQEFRETAEESQQSSRPDKISQQQAGPLGRIILAFANTPSQYARITKKAFLDLKNGRGDAKTNISKIVYYTLVQNLIFNAAQQALFALAFSDEDDEEFKDKKVARVANGMADSVLRGLGFGGAIASTVKNIAIKLEQQSKKKNPEYQDAIIDIVKISPPISSKITKLRSAARAYDWNKEEMKTEGVSINNPAALALGELTSAVTNVPLDRAIRKVQNVNASITDDLDFYQRLALLGGWNKWDLGISDKKKKKKKFKPVQSTGRKRIMIKIKNERDK